MDAHACMCNHITYSLHMHAHAIACQQIVHVQAHASTCKALHMQAHAKIAARRMWVQHYHMHAYANQHAN